MHKAESECVNGIACLLNAKDVSRILKVSEPTVYNLADRGQLKCVRWSCVGEGTKKKRDAVRFKKEDIFLDSIRDS